MFGARLWNPLSSIMPFQFMHPKTTWRDGRCCSCMIRLITRLHTAVSPQTWLCQPCQGFYLETITHKLSERMCYQSAIHHSPAIGLSTKPLSRVTERLKGNLGNFSLKDANIWKYLVSDCQQTCNPSRDLGLSRTLFKILEPKVGQGYRRVSAETSTE